jgi:hypothetical protein
MRFIEQLFGFAPDGGTGSTEYALFVVWAVTAALVMGFGKVFWGKRI